jgi:hypothetical protein
MPGGHLGRRVDLVRCSERRNALGEDVAVIRSKVTASEAAHRELKIADELTGKKFDQVNSAMRARRDQRRCELATTNCATRQTAQADSEPPDSSRRSLVVLERGGALRL